MADFAQIFLRPQVAAGFLAAKVVVLFFLAQKMFEGHHSLLPLIVLLAFGVFFNLATIRRGRGE